MLITVVLTTTCQLQRKPESIAIGLIAPLSGEFAATTGKNTLQGAKLAVEHINLNGGLKIDGKTYSVTLITEDDHDNPTDAVAAARKLIYEDNVVAIIGLPLSRIAIPVTEFLETVPIPAISSSSTNPRTTAGKKYIFRATFTDDFQGQALARFAFETLGARRAALLYDIASEYNRGLANYFSDEFKNLGGEIVASEVYTTDANRNFLPQLQHIKELEPDLLFLPNYSTELNQQAAQIREVGIQSILLGGDTWASSNPETYSKLEGGFYSIDWYPELSTSEAQKFLKSYQKYYQETPARSAAMSYETVGLLAEAIRLAGKTDSASIQKSMNQIQQYRGVGGLLQFKGSGNPFKPAFILQIRNSKPTFYKIINP